MLYDADGVMFTGELDAEEREEKKHVVGTARWRKKKQGRAAAGISKRKQKRLSEISKTKEVATSDPKMCVLRKLAIPVHRRKRVFLREEAAAQFADMHW